MIQMLANKRTTVYLSKPFLICVDRGCFLWCVCLSVGCRVLSDDSNFSKEPFVVGFSRIVLYFGGFYICATSRHVTL
jgi:hypothetical protein